MRVNAGLSRARECARTHEPGRLAIDKSLPCGRYIRADAFDDRRVFFGAVAVLVG
jgi:hypothetical protein